MNVEFKFASPDEADMYAYYYPSKKEEGIFVILDNLSEEYAEKQIADRFLQERLCMGCNGEDLVCSKKICPYEIIIDDLEEIIWN